MESPSAELDRRRRRPAIPLRAVSIWKVTARSTSSGAYPGASVMIVTVGAFNSGNTSTGIRGMIMALETTRIVARERTSPRRFSDQRMSAFNMDLFRFYSSFKCQVPSA